MRIGKHHVQMDGALPTVEHGRVVVMLGNPAIKIIDAELQYFCSLSLSTSRRITELSQIVLSGATSLYM